MKKGSILIVEFLGEGKDCELAIDILRDPLSKKCPNILRGSYAASNNNETSEFVISYAPNAGIKSTYDGECCLRGSTSFVHLPFTNKTSITNFRAPLAHKSSLLRGLTSINIINKLKK